MTETTGILGRVAEQERQRRAQQYADTYGNPGTTNPNDPGNATGAWWTYTEDDLNFGPAGGGGSGGGSGGVDVGGIAGTAEDIWNAVKGLASWGGDNWKDIATSLLAGANMISSAKRTAKADKILEDIQGRLSGDYAQNTDNIFADPYNPYARPTDRPDTPTDPDNWRNTNPDWQRADPDVQESSEKAFRDWYERNPTSTPGPADLSPIPTKEDPYPSTNPDFDKMDESGREDVRREAVKQSSEDAFRNWYDTNMPDSTPLVPDPSRADPAVRQTSEDAFRDWYARNEPDSTPAVPEPMRMADDMVLGENMAYSTAPAPTVIPKEDLLEQVLAQAGGNLSKRRRVE